MKSKLMIDLDEDNQPIIVVNYVPSDDVRDKMVATFLQSFGHISAWAKIQYQHNSFDSGINTGAKSIKIRPVFPVELEVTNFEVQRQSDEYKKMIAENTKG